MELVKSNEAITKLVKEVSLSQGLNTYEISKVQTNEKGTGFLGQFFIITVVDKATNKKLDLAVKLAFENTKLREVIPIRVFFENEVLFYTTLLPLYKTLLTEHGIPTLPFSPSCYKVSMEEPSECLILENIKVSGFEMFDTTKFLDDEHFKLIFKTYGRFHAYSIAFKDQKPEEFQQIADQFQDAYGLFFKGAFITAISTTSQTVIDRLVPNEDEDLIQNLQKYLGENAEATANASLDVNCDHSVLLHGDCWSNNLMFKYSETRQLEDIRLLDFQMMKLGSPVCDLSYCLYSGGSKESFDNLDKYLRIYHDSFSATLVELGSDPGLFPFEVLYQHWQKYARFGFIMSIPVFKTKLTESADIVDVKDYSESIGSVTAATESKPPKYDIEVYHKRLRDVLDHLNSLKGL